MNLYGVRKDDPQCAPIPIGKARLEQNHLVLDFSDSALQRFGTDLRPFILLSSHQLHAWPIMDANSLGLDQVRVYANPVNKRPDHRPLAWSGHVLTHPMAGCLLAVLKPALPPDRLSRLEAHQDGYLRRLGPPAPVRCRVCQLPRLVANYVDGHGHNDGFMRPSGIDHASCEAELARVEGDEEDAGAEPTERSESIHDAWRRGGSGGSAAGNGGEGGRPGGDGGVHGQPRPAPSPKVPRRAASAEQLPLGLSGPAPAVSAADSVLSIVPPYVINRSGPSPGPIKVRATRGAGLRFVTAGDLFDAERCPDVPGAVWVRSPTGHGYRLLPGEWTPASAKQPRRAG